MWAFSKGRRWWLQSMTSGLHTESWNVITDFSGEIHRCQIEFHEWRCWLAQNAWSMQPSSGSHRVEQNSWSAALEPGMLDGDRQQSNAQLDFALACFPKRSLIPAWYSQTHLRAGHLPIPFNTRSKRNHNREWLRRTASRLLNDSNYKMHAAFPERKVRIVGPRLILVRAE